MKKKAEMVRLAPLYVTKSQRRYLDRLKKKTGRSLQDIQRQLIQDKIDK